MFEVFFVMEIIYEKQVIYFLLYHSNVFLPRCMIEYKHYKRICINTDFSTNYNNEKVKGCNL